MRTIVVIGIYSLINLLATILIDHWLCRGSDKYKESVTARVLVCFLYLSIATVPILGNFITDPDMRYIVQRFSYAWFGYIMYFAGMLVIATPVALVMRAISKRKWDRKVKAAGDTNGSNDDEDGKTELDTLDPDSEFNDEDASDLQSEGSDAPAITGPKRHKKAYVITFILILLITIGLNVYGMIHARDTVVKEYDITINKKVTSTKKLKVALISDIHIAFNSSKSMIKNMVNLINEQRPDVVVVTGDLISSDYHAISDPKGYAKILSGIESKEGVYWVYGNHDVQEPLFCGFALKERKYALRTEKIEGFIKACGFTPLEDSAVAIAGGEVQLVGRKDYEKPGDGTRTRLSAAELLTDIDNNKPIILLEHEPIDYEELAKFGTDISLSGHTHAGQIFPGTIVTSLLNDMTYGLEMRHGMQVLVTSGVGFYGAPLRIGTNSEIVIANMTFAG